MPGKSPRRPRPYSFCDPLQSKTPMSMSVRMPVFEFARSND